jgi:hypothetical protein
VTRRTVTVSTKVSTAESERLLSRAAELGLSPSEYYRHLLLGDPLTARLYALFKATYRASVRDELTMEHFEEIVSGIENEETEL